MYSFIQHGVGGDKASCATIDANGAQTAGTNYIQIPGAVNVNEFTGDSFCGGKLSNFALDPTVGPDALGANVHSTVIGKDEPNNEQRSNISKSKCKAWI